MTLTLQRVTCTPTATMGFLAVAGHFQCFTLEDAVHDGPKVPGATAIPAGRYAVLITPSQRFGVLLPLVQGVPGFSGIRIHAGNTTQDTAGCILVGQSIVGERLEHSRAALAALQPQMAAAQARGLPVWLEVVNPLPLPTETIQ